MNLGRAIAIVLLTLLIFGVSVLREVVGPTATGYRIAMTSAPNGKIYFSDGQSLYIEGPDGRKQTLSALPKISPCLSPLSLANSASTFLLGCDNFLYASYDSGRSWQKVSISGQRFIAVAADGNNLAAASWGYALWTSIDGGKNWQKANLTSGDLQFNSVSIGPLGWALATQLGLSRAPDGINFEFIPGFDRMSSVGQDGSLAWATSWNGDFYTSPDLRHWSLRTSVPSGIWAADSFGDLATGRGLHLAEGLAPASLQHREIVAIYFSAPNLYVAVAPGEIWLAEPSARELV